MVSSVGEVAVVVWDLLAHWWLFVRFFLAGDAFYLCFVGVVDWGV